MQTTQDSIELKGAISGENGGDIRVLTQPSASFNSVFSNACPPGLVHGCLLTRNQVHVLSDGEGGYGAVRAGRTGRSTLLVLG